MEKVKKAVLIALTIYIVLMYLALITKTSSFTYGETQVGYKGWFESGNSIGTIKTVTNITIKVKGTPILIKSANL